VKTGQSEFATARLPPGDGEPDQEEGGTVVAEPGLPADVDPRDVLGVIPEDDEETIERRARTLKKKHHPDQGGDPEQFQRVLAAEQHLLED
jgi:DnaJ-domain-containing protein 1